LKYICWNNYVIKQFTIYNKTGYWISQLQHWTIIIKGRYSSNVAQLRRYILSQKDDRAVFLQCRALKCMSSKNESFPFCARAQIKCSAYSSFGRNVARKSVKNLTRDTAVAIPRAECRRCRLSFSRGREEGAKVSREKWGILSVVTWLSYLH